MELIDKADVVAKIERIISNGQTELKKSEECKDYESYVALSERIATCINVLSFLNTIEVKEVDLKKEIYDAEKRFGDIDEMGGYRILIFDDDFRDILRHFFELGLKAQKGGGE